MLFAELVRARGGLTAETDVHAFHARVNAAWGDGGAKWGQPVGDDKFVFWRARWREEQGTTVVPPDSPPRSMFAPGTSTPELVDAVRESLREKRR